MKNTIIILSLFVIITSCKKKEVEPDETTPIKITVSDFTTTMTESPVDNQSIGTVSASTNQGVITFSIFSESNLGALSIDPSSGELSVNSKLLFDFETNPTITAVIKAVNGNTSENINVTISLTDIAAVITASNYSLTLVENPTSNFQNNLGNVGGTSTEGSISYQIISQTTANAISIDGNGKMTVNDLSAFDYENDPSIEVTIRLTSSGTTKDIIATFTLTDVFETVNAHNLSSVTIAENPLNDYLLSTATASVDGDGRTPSYTLQSESVTGAFKVNATTGAITVKDRSKFNDESNTSLNLTVRISANAATTPYQDITFTVNLTDVSNTSLTEKLLDQGYTINQALSDGHTPLELYNILGTTSGILGATYQGGTIATLNTTTGTGILISNDLGTSNWATASLLASNLTDGGNSDWKLPSRAEIDLIADRLPVSSSYYWSREVYSSTMAYLKNKYGSWRLKNKTELHLVRAIRSF